MLFVADPELIVSILDKNQKEFLKDLKCVYQAVNKESAENELHKLEESKHSVNHVFLSPTSIINFTSKKQSYDDTRRSSRDNELLQRAQSDL